MAQNFKALAYTQTYLSQKSKVLHSWELDVDGCSLTVELLLLKVAGKGILRVNSRTVIARKLGLPSPFQFELGGYPASITPARTEYELVVNGKSFHALTVLGGFTLKSRRVTHPRVILPLTERRPMYSEPHQRRAGTFYLTKAESNLLSIFETPEKNYGQHIVCNPNFSVPDQYRSLQVFSAPPNSL